MQEEEFSILQVSDGKFLAGVAFDQIHIGPKLTDNTFVSIP